MVLRQSFAGIYKSSYENLWCHDIRYHDTQQNDINCDNRQNFLQHDGIILCKTRLNIVRSDVIRQSVIMPSVAMVNVMVPQFSNFSFILMVLRQSFAGILKSSYENLWHYNIDQNDTQLNAITIVSLNEMTLSREY